MAGRCAAGAGMIAALRLRGVLSRRERERARRPARASFEPGGVYAGFAAISSEGSLPPRRRNCFLADSPSAPFGRRRICVGVEVCRGSLLPRHLEIASYRERTDRRAACRPISENAKFAQVTSSLGRNVDCASARQRARRTSIHTCSYMSMASVMSWKNSQRAMTSSSGFMTAYTRASSSSRVSATAFMGVE